MSAGHLDRRYQKTAEIAEIVEKPQKNCCLVLAGLLRSTPALKARVGRPSEVLDRRSPYFDPSHRARRVSRA